MTWTLYKEIKYAMAGIPDADLTDFPVPVWIATDADIAAELGSGGGIKFTSADGMTDLAFGLYQSTNLAAGTVHARVKISPDADASVGTVAMRLYYSASESTTEDKAGTVSNGYELFAPLEEDPSGSAPQMRDWVTNTLLGTSIGSMTSGDVVSGKLGNAIDFDREDDGINFGSGSNLDNLSAMTIEAWIKPKANASGNYGIVTKALDANGFSDGWGLRYVTSGGNSNRRLTFTADWTAGDPGAQSVTTLIDELNVWHRISVTYDWTNNSGGSAIAFRRNGASLANNSTTASAGSRLNDVSLDVVVGGNSLMEIDEVSVSSVVRSDDWIDYGYVVEENLDDLWALSDEQGGGDTFTATAALQTGGAAFAASASHTPPTFAAEAALETGGAAFAAEATHTAPVSTATAALVCGAVQFAALETVPTTIPWHSGPQAIGMFAKKGAVDRCFGPQLIGMFSKKGRVQLD